MNKRTIMLGVLIFMVVMTSCQTAVKTENHGWANSIRGATALDRKLIFRQEKLRKAYKAGALNTEMGLHETEMVKLVIQREDNQLYVTFFGTDDMAELYYDATNWQEPYWTQIDSAIKVHAGFNRPLQDAMEPVLTAMNNFLQENPNRENRGIYILGHSAGGVHAVLCAFTLKDRFTAIEDGEIYVQIGGAPAPGNQAFASHFNRMIRCHRYINGSDRVPYLLTPSRGYVHVGEAYQIGPEPNKFTAASGLWLGQHFIGDYADSLRENNKE